MKNIFKKWIETKIFFICFTCLFILGLLILILPLIPQLKFKVESHNTINDPEYPVSYFSLQDSSFSKKYLTDGNRLTIPSIGVDSKILEGPSESILDLEEGVWMDSESDFPNEQGNMVIAGHRFQYLPPNTSTFYHLDKVKIDEKINVYWEGIKYTYKVFDIYEVNPDAVWIKNQSGDVREITLYTCTPLYTSTRRLVIKGELIQ